MRRRPAGPRWGDPGRRPGHARRSRWTLIAGLGVLALISLQPAAPVYLEPRTLVRQPVVPLLGAQLIGPVRGAGHRGSITTSTVLRDAESGGFAGAEWQAEQARPYLTSALDAFDPVDNETVFTQGSSDAPVTTWALQGASWVQIPGGPDASESLAQSQLVWDGSDGYLLSLGQDIANSSWGLVGDTWAKIPMSSTPPERSSASVAFDPSRPGVVLFGGENSTGVLGDTWSYSDGNWTGIVSPVAPAPRYGAALTYDPGLDALVLFGGFGVSQGIATPFNDTWKFDASGWAELNLTEAPAVAAGDVESLFVNPETGGLTLALSPSDGLGMTVWTLNGSAWIPGPNGLDLNRTVVAPPVATPGQGLMCLSTESSEDSPFASGYPEIWTEANETWMPSSEPLVPPSDSTLVSDPSLGGIVAIPPVSELSSNSSELWVFANGSWSQRSVAGAPGNRSGESLAFDTAMQSILLFSGQLSTAQGPNDATWLLSAVGWREVVTPPSETLPSPGSGLPMAYDPAVGGVILVEPAGPLNRSQTWEFIAGNWTRIATPGPPVENASDAVIAWDASDHLLVLYGAGESCPCNQTWTFAAGVWSNVTAPGPGNRLAPALATAPGGGVVLFGGAVLQPGASAGTGPILGADTWIWRSGGWTNVSPPQILSPSPRDDASVAFDSIAHALVLFGGDSSSGPGSSAPYQDTWEYSNVSAAIVLPIRGVLASPSSLPLGNSTELTVLLAGSGLANISWLDLAGGCTSLNESTLNCSWDAPGVYEPIVRVAAPGAPAAFARTLVTMFPGLSVLLTANTSVTRPGEAVRFRALTSGGVPPFVFSSRGSSYGGVVTCTSTANPTFTCEAAIPGVYVVNVTVEDAVGAVGGASTSFCVFTGGGICVAPHVLAFAVMPAVARLGSTVQFSIAASGSPPLGFRFEGLPGGCLSQNTDVLNCTPLASGTFLIRSVVTDPLKVSVDASVTLVITGAAPPNFGRSSGPGSFNWPGVDIGIASVLALGTIAGGVFQRRPPRAPREKSGNGFPPQLPSPSEQPLAPPGR